MGVFSSKQCLTLFTITWRPAKTLTLGPHVHGPTVFMTMATEEEKGWVRASPWITWIWIPISIRYGFGMYKKNSWKVGKEIAISRRNLNGRHFGERISNIAKAHGEHDTK